MSRTGARLAFPVGHYAGERPNADHRVRVGRAIETLSGDEFAVWVLSHGSSGGGKAPWTVDEVVSVADQAEVRAASDAAESLLKRGLLAAVPAEPTAPAAAAFARNHALRALLTGIGDTPERPGTCAVGIPGTDAVAWLDPDAYELWQWGPLAPSLWHVCEVRAVVSTELGMPLEASQALNGLLADLRLLLANSCAYIDVADPGQV